MREEDIALLRSLIPDPERVSVKGADLDAHSVDESYHQPHRPDVVVWAKSAQEVSAVLKFANERLIPVTPWSGGSSLEGNPIPVQGGIVLSLYQMNEVLEVRPEDLQVRVQPGIIYDELNKRLRRYGLFFPPAPASADVATIGGMVANNSSGMHAVKYGTTKDYVLKLEVVLPTGEIITVGSNAIKSSSGYDLVRLFVGSEGTLGVVTEVTLRLRGLPEKVMAATAIFNSPEDAARAVFETIASGIVPAALELMDEEVVRTVNLYKGLSLRQAPMLFLEFHGSAAGVQEEAEAAREICLDNGALEFALAESAEERERLWEARREAFNALKYLDPRFAVILGDIAVPISRYPEAVHQAYRIAEEEGVRIGTFGHAGDGNLHVAILMEKENEEAKRRAHRVNERVVEMAIGLGGTATGEHGVGIGKRRFMTMEHGDSLELMRRIKALLDPNGILNPGKIFP